MPEKPLITPAGGSPILAWRSAFFVCFLVAILLLVFLPAGFTSFAEHTIGVAVMKNINPNYRTAVYILSLLAAISLFCSLFLSAPLARQKQVEALCLRVEPLSRLLLVCALGNLSIYFVTGEQLYLRAGLLSGLMLALCLLSGRYAKARETVFLQYFCIGWQAATVVCLLGGWAPGETFWLLCVSVCLGGVLTDGRHGPILQKLLPLLFCWLLLAPLFFIAANEINYIALKRGVTASSPLLVFALLSLTTVVVLGFYRCRNVPSLYLGALALLVTSSVLNEYSSAIAYRSFDVFHLGEKLLPLQQWLSFSGLPFIDYLPVHGLFDVFPHFIYQQLTGSALPESLLWGDGYFTGWLMRAIAIGLLFAFIAKAMAPSYAFLLLWLLPSFHLLDPYNTLLLLPALHLFNLAKWSRPLWWWLVQWVLCVLVLLWRMDFGLVVIVASVAVAILLSWYYASYSHLLRAISSGFLVLLIILIASLLVLGGQQLFSTALLVKAYIGNQALVGAYETFYKAVNYPMLMQYIVLPGLTCLIAAYSVSQIVRREVSQNKFLLDLVIVFISAVALMVSLRSLHRHSLLEGLFKNYLFVLVMFFYIARSDFLREKAVLYSVLGVFLVVSFLGLPKGDEKLMRTGFHISSEWEYPAGLNGESWPQWENKTTRLTDNVRRFNSFLAFMEQNLASGQTFFEFTNAPLLYVLADVEVPVYIFETVYQSSDTIQRATVQQLSGLYKAERLPYVVFRQNNFWDKLDGVDNALRSYLVAEFIYQHYSPCLMVSGFDIWVDNRVASPSLCKQYYQQMLVFQKGSSRKLKLLAPGQLVQPMDFHSIAYLWANFGADTGESFSSRQLLSAEPMAAGWELNSGSLASCLGMPCYLDLQIEASAGQVVELAFSQQKQASFTTEAGSQAYRIRISSLWHWHRLGAMPHPIMLSSDAPFTVLKAELLILEDGAGND